MKLDDKKFKKQMQDIVDLMKGTTEDLEKALDGLSRQPREWWVVHYGGYDNRLAEIGDRTQEEILHDSGAKEVYRVQEIIEPPTIELGK